MSLLKKGQKKIMARLLQDAEAGLFQWDKKAIEQISGESTSGASMSFRLDLGPNKCTVQFLSSRCEVSLDYPPRMIRKLWQMAVRQVQERAVSEFLDLMESENEQ